MAERFVVLEPKDTPMLLDSECSCACGVAGGGG